MSEREFPVVTVSGGQIRGYTDGNGVMTFKGIPFAASTAGENRFCDPKPAEPWNGIRDCTAFGPIVMQDEARPFMCWTAEYVDGGLNYENGRMSEDSLNLNIWTKGREGDRLPVIVYIHGGANTSGSGQNEVYTGEKIALKNVVFVTINYRVGLFGFLVYKDADGNEISGNFALKDQIAALTWIRGNIARFGGDPDNVTISGQSAGSENVQKLMLSPKAAGLFRRAVAMSANGYDGFGPMGVHDRAAAMADARKAFGAFTVAQLRAMDSLEADALRKTYNPNSHITDGEYLLSSQKEAYRSGRFNHVDFMTGCVTGDTGLFGQFIVRPEGMEKWTEDTYRQEAGKKLGTLAEDFFAAYPPEDDMDAYARRVDVDNANAQYAYAIAKKASKDGEGRNYQWYFSKIVPDADPAAQAMWGAFHTGDVGYWFNYFSPTSARPWTETDYALGELMSSYLVNFAATGDPNAEGLPRWDQSPRDGGIGYMHLDSESVFETADPQKAAFWKKYYDSVD